MTLIYIPLNLHPLHITCRYGSAHSALIGLQQTLRGISLMLTTVAIASFLYLATAHTRF